MQYYQPYLLRPERMKVTGGKQIHLVNLRTCFMAYFGRAGIEFRPTFPWMFMPSSAHVYPDAELIPWSGARISFEHARLRFVPCGRDSTLPVGFAGRS